MNKKGDVLGFIVFLILLAAIISVCIIVATSLTRIVFKDDTFCKEKGFTFGRYYSYDSRIVCSATDSNGTFHEEIFDVEKHWNKYIEVENET